MSEQSFLAQSCDIEGCDESYPLVMVLLDVGEPHRWVCLDCLFEMRQESKREKEQEGTSETKQTEITDAEENS